MAEDISAEDDLTVYQFCPPTSNFSFFPQDEEAVLRMAKVRGYKVHKLIIILLYNSAKTNINKIHHFLWCFEILR
jgi:hypothetical protein